MVERDDIEEAELIVMVLQGFGHIKSPFSLRIGMGSRPQSDRHGE
jgi:hypothetical protein